MSNTPQEPSPQPKAGDPAMDDILASIRRILNEDEAPGVGQAGAAGQPAAEPLQLTEAMMVEPTPVAAPPAPPTEPAPAALPVAADSLVAPAVVAATTAAVGQLLRAVAQERGAPVHRGGPSIEDVVREELRPLLKEWLDQHLPPIVERLVRAEIERVVSRGLG
jgi:cell pole-organizing protein PopZ